MAFSFKGLAGNDKTCGLLWFRNFSCSQQEWWTYIHPLWKFSLWDAWLLDCMLSTDNDFFTQEDAVGKVVMHLLLWRVHFSRKCSVLREGGVCDKSCNDIWSQADPGFPTLPGFWFCRGTGTVKTLISMWHENTYTFSKKIRFNFLEPRGGQLLFKQNRLNFWFSCYKTQVAEQQTQSHYKIILILNHSLKQHPDSKIGRFYIVQWQHFCGVRASGKWVYHGLSFDFLVMKSMKIQTV